MTSDDARPQKTSAQSPESGKSPTLLDEAECAALLPEVETRRNLWQRRLSLVISLIILGAVAAQFNLEDLRKAWTLVPSSPLFWVLFAIYYIAEPVSSLYIFHRLWRLPLWSGFVALTRKLVVNELFVGYSGELYFYGWVRAKADISSTPFGAIKDVAITSAIAGNLTTLALLPLAIPALHRISLKHDLTPFFWSVGFLVAISIIPLLLRRRIFTMPAHELRHMLVVQFIRVAITVLCLTLLWWLALPGLSWPIICVLAAVRMLLSRLPLLPNKDIILAGLVAFVEGGGTDLGAMLAMFAAVLLAAHLIVGLLCGISGLSHMKMTGEK